MSADDMSANDMSANEDLSRLFDLEPHGPDTFVGIGPRYPWGGLFGGQIVAQSLRAAAATVDPAQSVHSLRAYFIRRGDHTQPIRFEVDRIRNGRSFTTRRVVARQANGAILNLEASFQLPEDTDDIQTVDMDASIPGPESLVDDSWTPSFERRAVAKSDLSDEGRTGRGRNAVWMRVTNRSSASSTTSPSRRASITPSGSIVRCTLISGICTTSPCTATPELGAWPSGTCSGPMAFTWPRSPRKY
jgi:acyl-CoA thioesterase